MTDGQKPLKYGDDLPSNSRKSKENATPAGKKPEKLNKVISGEAVRSKPSVGKRFVESFTGDDSRSVGQYILFDVILPAAKSTLYDAVSGGFERLLYGDRGGSFSGVRRGYNNTPYNRVSTANNNPMPGRNAPSTAYNNQPKSVHTYDDVIVESRAAAEQVIDELAELVNAYGEATLSDFYDLVGITGNYMDEKWGWTSLVGAHPERHSNGFLIKLPRAVALRQ